jgi:hypothetical protein
MDGTLRFSGAAHARARDRVRLLRFPLLAALPAFPGLWPPPGWTPLHSVIALGGFGCLALAAIVQLVQSQQDARAGRRRPAQRRAARRGTAVAVPRPVEAPAAVHLVCGAHPELTVHAALEVARDFLVRGERILLVDAGRRVALHEALVREARWGFGEVMRGAMPLLGVVQDSGLPNLYLLARGGAGAEEWAGLGRLLDDAAPHFARVVLAVDPACPHAAGEALMGRVVEGWWAGEGALPRGGMALAERTGIRFRGIGLSPSLNDTLEAMLELPFAAVPCLKPVPRPAPPPAIVEPEPILEWNAAVGERLRFLAWMRRIGTSEPLATAR